MRILPPLITTGTFGIDPSMLTSSSAAEPGSGETAWNGSAHSYAVGDVVYLASTHLVYRSRTAHTSGVGNTPALATIDTPSTDWIALYPTNKYRMFDALRSTGTTIASGGTVVLTPGRRADSIGFAGLSNVGSIQIVGTRGATTVFDSTLLNLSTRRIGTSFYQFFFAPFTYKSEFALWNLPPFTDMVITITVNSPSGTGDCVIGDCVIGMQEYIGRVLSEPENDALNFSKIDRVFDGTATVIRRRNVPKNSQQVLIEKDDTSRIEALRERLNGVPAIYSALDDSSDGYFSSFFRKGLYKRWAITPKTQTHAILTMEIEEI